MASLYGLAIQVGKKIFATVGNGLLYIKGNYKSTQERIAHEKSLEAVAKDYNSVISDIKIRTPSETLNEMGEGYFPDSLAGLS